MKLRSHQSLISSQLWMMREGESVTFSRPVRSLPIDHAGNRLSQMLNSYVSRRRPGCEWKFESFTVITHAGNIYAGVIVTLVKDSSAEKSV